MDECSCDAVAPPDSSTDQRSDAAAPWVVPFLFLKASSNGRRNNAGSAKPPAAPWGLLLNNNNPPEPSPALSRLGACRKWGSWDGQGKTLMQMSVGKIACDRFQSPSISSTLILSPPTHTTKYAAFLLRLAAPLLLLAALILLSLAIRGVISVLLLAHFTVAALLAWRGAGRLQLAVQETEQESGLGQQRLGASESCILTR